MAAPNAPALRVRAWVQGGWSGGGEGLSLLLTRPFSPAPGQEAPSSDGLGRNSHSRRVSWRPLVPHRETEVQRDCVCLRSCTELVAGL